MKRNISRRDFLKITIASISAILTACMPRISRVPESAPTPVLKETPQQPTKTDTPTPKSTPSPSIVPTSATSIRLLTPEDNTHLNAEGKVIFSWEPTAGASFYRLKITLPTNQVVIFDSEQTSRDLYLEALWLGGRYQWSVTAYDARGEVICIADPFSFDKPELIIPSPTVVQEEDEEPTSDGAGSEGTPSTASGSFSDVSEG